MGTSDPNTLNQRHTRRVHAQTITELQTALAVSVRALAQQEGLLDALRVSDQNRRDTEATMRDLKDPVERPLPTVPPPPARQPGQELMCIK